MNKSKLRTPSQLNDFISEELAWRRKELIELKALLQTKSQSTGDVFLRSALTVLYAHWEGFIKTCATAYICFVAMQRLRYEELANNFLGLSMKQKITEMIEANSPKLHSEFVTFFLEQLPHRSQMNWEGVVNVGGNLSSTALREILELLGLEYLSQYETKKNLIDEKLLANRHAAAHGEFIVNIDIKGFFELYKHIVGEKDERGLMALFSDQIANAAIMENYKKR